MVFFIGILSGSCFCKLPLVPSKVACSLANAAKEKRHVKHFKGSIIAWNCVVRKAFYLSSEFH